MDISPRQTLRSADYSEAETNAQWMMNLRPNNTPALLVGATLRTLYGDTQARSSFSTWRIQKHRPPKWKNSRGSPTSIASIQIDSGENDAAAQTLEQADQLFPDYPYTIENLARVRMGQNRAKESVQLWIKALL